MKIPTLLVLAGYLLTITKYLRLGKRGNDLVPLADVQAAAVRWAKRRPRPAKTQKRRFSERRFRRIAKEWLQFMECLEAPEPVAHKYIERVTAFVEFQEEKGLSPQTISYRRRVVQTFLDRLCGDNKRMEEFTLDGIDTTLSEKAIAGHLKRASIRSYAECLRVFFQYAETRGWCRNGLGGSITAPCIYAQESIPMGPSRDDVKRLLATTEGNRRTDIRDRAILMLLIVYGFRNGEVRQLRLDDLDWESELIRLRRSKQGRTQFFPLSRTVGDAILRYLKDVRPQSSHREVFLALNAPLRPLLGAALRQMVSSRLRTLGVSLPHYGPHALRHACATHLLERGHSMKEIGDYLGHFRPESTFIYAKANLTALRSVADFSLEGLQ